MFNRELMLQILSEDALNLTPGTTPPSDYVTLRDSVIQLDFDNHYRQLKALFSSDQTEEAIKAAFKALCAKRADANQGTALSYFAMPQGHANELFWKIALEVFKPETMAEMIAIIMPKVDVGYEIEIAIARQSAGENKSLRERATASLTEQPIAALFTLPPDIKELDKLILVRGKLFDLSQLGQLSLDDQQIWYDFAKTDAELKEKIYTHNDAFKKIQSQMELLDGNGRTVASGLETLAKQLKMEGSAYTGSGETSFAASEYMRTFGEYLELMPEELKTSVLQLKTGEGKTLDYVFYTHLGKQRDCVETGSKMLFSILSQPGNEAILAKRPAMTEDQLQKLKKSYKETKDKGGLPLSGHDETKRLPDEMSTQLLSRLEISSDHDYIDLLMGLPSDQVQLFLSRAKLNELPSRNLMTSGVLGKEKTELLLDGINNLAWLIEMGSSGRALAKLRGMSKSARLAVVNEKDNAGKTLLHNAVSSGQLDVVRELLNLYPEQDRLAVVKERDGNDKTMLHHAASSSQLDVVRELLNLYPVQERLAAVEESDLNGGTVLHCAGGSGQWDVLRELLSLYPEQDRLAAVNKRDDRDNTVLGLSVCNDKLEVVRGLLGFLRAEDRLVAVKEARKVDQSMLYYVVRLGQLEMLRELLSLYPVQDRLAVVSERDWDGRTMLHYAAMNGKLEMLRELLNLYPEQDRLAAVKEEDKAENTVLHHAAKSGQLEMLRELLNLYPVQDRSAVVNQKFRDYDTFLHFAAGRCKWEVVRELLSALPSNDRAAALITVMNVKRHDTLIPFDQVHLNQFKELYNKQYSGVAYRAYNTFSIFGLTPYFNLSTLEGKSPEAQWNAIVESAKQDKYIATVLSNVLFESTPAPGQALRHS